MVHCYINCHCEAENNLLLYFELKQEFVKAKEKNIYTSENTVQEICDITFNKNAPCTMKKMQTYTEQPNAFNKFKHYNNQFYTCQKLDFIVSGTTQ